MNQVYYQLFNLHNKKGIITFGQIIVLWQKR